MTVQSQAAALRALLEGIIDYAGLFPPAKLDMEPTVGNYARYLAGPDSWMLGRLAVPVARLDEFERCAGDLLPRGEGVEPWRITAIGPAAGEPGLEADLERIAAFNETHASPAAGLAAINVIELRARSAAAIEEALGRIPDDLFPFFELAIDRDPRGALAALSGCDAGAKVRTGGMTPDKYPSPADLARFIAACAAAGLPFKATAALHHPVRHRNDTVGCDEFGFLGVFVAAALLHNARIGPGGVEGVLNERSHEAFAFDGVLRYGGHELDADALHDARRRFAISIGSCSFEEPLDHLRALNLL